VRGVAPGWTADSAADFASFIAPLSNWGRWGDDDDLGTVNLLTPERVSKATALVRTGRTLSLARTIRTSPSADNPQPVLHLMKSSGDAAAAVGGSHASDWMGLAYHGFAVTHLDAYSHQFFNGRMYNGYLATEVSTRTGAARGSVQPLARGLLGRGVLLDAPRAVGRDWLDPGEGVGADELDAVAAAQRTALEPGDLLLVRTGRDARAQRHGVLDPMTAGSPGLTREALAWLRQHDVAVLGSDVQSDVMQPGAPAHPMPVHVGALAYLGLPLLDNLVLDALASTCAERGTWEFLIVVAPLPLRGFTGSPVNPLAVL
jgi:kynurenine formamidase